jgi:hypothetical protein
MHEELFEKIESERFSATMNVVSGLKQFVRAVSSSAEFQELLASLQTKTEPAAVLGRFHEVADRPTDLAHESPWDVAMASYLLLLDRVDPRQSLPCAERALAYANGWWSRKIADAILAGNRDGLLGYPQGRSPVSSGV